MGSLCECPNADALESIADFDCPVDFSEVAKIVFSRQRDFQKTGALPLLDIDIATLAEWVDTLAAVDGTKSLITPIVDDVENEPGAAIVEELTIRNIVTGLEVTTFNGLIAGAPAATIASFKKLSCEKTLFVYFIDANGDIIYFLDGVKPQGFKLSNNSFVLQDTEMTKRTINKNRFSFQLEPGWSDGAKKQTPIDFDALVDLTN